MVGFALAHDTRAIVPLGLSILVVLLWLPSAVVWLIMRARKGWRPSRAEWIELALSAVGLLLITVVPAST